MVKFALIGYGKFGKNYERVIVANEIGEITWFCTKNLRDVPNWSDNYKDVCAKENVDAVIIATPPDTHYEICKFALENKKHVICEKPFVFKAEEAKELKELAEKNNLSLMVDYIHLWNNEIVKIAQSIKEPKSKTFVSMETTANGNDRPDCSILWDWYSHDLSILYYIFGDGFTNLGFNQILFDGKNNKGVISVASSHGSVLAHSYINNQSLVKSRQISITSDENEFLFIDDFKGGNLDNFLNYFVEKVESGGICSNAEIAVAVTEHIEQITKREQ